MTFLITDIEGSTALLRRLGEAEYAQALARYRQLTRSAVDRHHGDEIDTQGDSFFVVFSSPRAAVTAAVEMQHSFLSEGDGASLRVRMGLHSGEAERTPTGLVGLAVHRAARIAAVAHGGQVLLSESTAILLQDALPSGLTLKDLGRHRLKDLGTPQQIFELEAAGLPTEFPPLRSLDNPALPNNLPAQLTNFVGRARELDEIRGLVTTHRLVTLTGPGGSGKTRLALQVAAELLDGAEDGAWFVELAMLDDEEAIPAAIASALGLSLPIGPSVESLAAALSSQRILLVLDNCEHLVGGCAKVADALLRRGRQVHVLATSREPLAISGEAIYRVRPLAVPDEDGVSPDAQEFDAVALLLDRAGSQGADLDLDPPNLSLLVSICRRLDGMPLAIELAAARLRSLSLETLEQRLDQRFRLLTGGNRNAPERQQTLRATVAWSVSLLSVPERTLLDRLSAFVGGFELEAAEKVCGFGSLEDVEVADLLGSLVDKSLVMAQRRGSGVRYRLLETIREYAAGELAESGRSEADQVARAHVQYFLEVAESAAAGFDGADQAVWFKRFEQEEANVARALERAAAEPEGMETLLRFGKALRRSWMLLRPRAKEIVTAAVVDPRAMDHTVLLAHALVSCSLGARGNEAELALPFSARALELARGLDDERLLLDALFSRATSCYFAARSEDGIEVGREAVERARKLGDPRMLAASLMAFLLCADNLDSSATGNLFGEAIAAARAAGDGDLLQTVHNNAAVHELRQGDLIAARHHLEAGIAIAEDVAPGRVHYSLVNLGWVLWQQDELERARSFFLRSLRMTRRIGDLSGISYAVLGLACILVEEERWPEAAETLGAAQVLRDRAGGRWEDPEASYLTRCCERVRNAIGDRAFDEGYLKGMSNTEALTRELARAS